MKIKNAAINKTLILEKLLLFFGIKLSNPSVKKLISYLLALLVGTLLTVYFTFPIIFNLYHSYPSNSDFYMNGWTYWYTSKSILTGSIFNIPVFFNSDHLYPFPGTLAQQDYMLLPSLLFYLPLFKLTANHVFSVNMLILITFLLNFISSFYFTKKIINNFYASLVASIIFSFAPNVINLWGGHLEYLSRFLIPPMTYFFVRSLDKFRIKDIFFCLFFYILQWFTSIELAIFTTVLFMLSGLIYIALNIHHFKSWKIKNTLFYPLIGLIFLPLVWHFFSPYLEYSNKENFHRTENEIKQNSVSFLDFFIPFPNNLVFGNISKAVEGMRLEGKNEVFNYSENTMSVGILALVLVLIFLFKLPKKIKKTSHDTRVIVLLLLVSFLMSLGPKITLYKTEITTPYHFIYKQFKPLQSIRTPTRIKYISLYFVSVLAGASLINMSTNSKKKTLFYIGVIMWLMIEQKSQFNIQKIEYKPINYALANKKVLFLPIRGEKEPINDSGYSIYNIQNKLISINGSTGSEYLISGFFPFIYNLKNYAFTEYWFDLLRSIGTDFVIIDKLRVQNEPLLKDILSKNKPFFESLKVYEDENWQILEIEKYSRKHDTCAQSDPDDLNINFRVYKSNESSDFIIEYSGDNKRKCNIIFLNEDRYVPFKYSFRFKSGKVEHASSYLTMPIFLQDEADFQYAMNISPKVSETPLEISVEFKGRIYNFGPKELIK